MSGSSYLNETDFHESLIDLMHLSIKNITENTLRRTSNDTEKQFFNQLLLFSANIVLNLMDKKDHLREYAVDNGHIDDPNEKKVLFNYLKVSSSH
jgi:hypothetical protein